MRLTPISRASTPGIRLLQFLVVIWWSGSRQPAPFGSFAWSGTARDSEIGRSLPTTCNDSAKSTEAAASVVGYEATERRFKGATLWPHLIFYRLSLLAEIHARAEPSRAAAQDAATISAVLAAVAIGAVTKQPSAQHGPEDMIPKRCADTVVAGRKSMVALMMC